MRLINKLKKTISAQFQTVADEKEEGVSNCNCSSCDLQAVPWILAAIWLLILLCPTVGFLGEAVYIFRNTEGREKCLWGGWSVLTTLIATVVGYGVHQATPDNLIHSYSYRAYSGSNYTDGLCEYKYDPTHCYTVSRGPYILAFLGAGTTGFLVLNLPIIYRLMRRRLQQNNQRVFPEINRQRCIVELEDSKNSLPHDDLQRSINNFPKKQEIRIFKYPSIILEFEGQPSDHEKNQTSERNPTFAKGGS